MKINQFAKSLSENIARFGESPGLIKEEWLGKNIYAVKYSMPDSSLEADFNYGIGCLPEVPDCAEHICIRAVGNVRETLDFASQDRVESLFLKDNGYNAVYTEFGTFDLGITVFDNKPRYEEFRRTIENYVV